MANFEPKMRQLALELAFAASARHKLLALDADLLGCLGDLNDVASV